MPETSNIILEVWRKDVHCGYVGEAIPDWWPLVVREGDASTYNNSILAEGAATQYFGYLREKAPERLEGMTIKYVQHIPQAA